VKPKVGRLLSRGRECTDPYTIFVYPVRSPYTKQSNFRDCVYYFMLLTWLEVQHLTNSVIPLLIKEEMILVGPLTV
jgi:hypothetical protein